MGERNDEMRDSVTRHEFYQMIIRAYADPLCAQQYAAKLFSERTPPIRKALDEFAESIPKGGFVVDLGCGTGKDVQYLRARSIDAVGIDISRPMINKAKELVGPEHFIERDLRDLGCFPSHSCDGLLALASMQHVYRSDLEDVLGQIHIILRATGILLIITKEGHGLYLDKRLGERFIRPSTLFTREEMEAHLVARGFAISSLSAFSLARDGLVDNWIAVLARPS
jgi:SAM-dependent methyltransferase